MPTVSPVFSWLPFCQLEIQLVGSNLHRLSAGARLPRLRILPHARVLHHVKTRRLVLVLEVDDEGVGRTVGHAGAVRIELGAIRQDRLLDRVLRSHVEIAARAHNVDDRWTADFNMDIAFGNHVLHGIVRLEQQRPLVGGQSAIRLIDLGIQQNRLPRHFLNDSAAAGDRGGMIAGGDDVHVRLQLQFIVLGIVVRALG